MDPSTKESTCMHMCRQGYEDFHCKICSYCSFLSVISLWANNHVRIIQEKNVRDHANFIKEVVFKRLILQYTVHTVVLWLICQHSVQYGPCKTLKLIQHLRSRPEIGLSAHWASLINLESIKTKLFILKDCTHAIITGNLYTYSPIFEGQKRIF